MVTMARMVFARERECVDEADIWTYKLLLKMPTKGLRV